MTTTIMRNSIVGDDWIRAMQMAVPPQKVIKDGKWTGDILSGPVRLSFPVLFTLPQATAQRANPKFGASLIFPPPLPGQSAAQQFALFYEEYYRIAAEKFAAHWDAGSQQYFGLHSPFHDQGEKAIKYAGYTPGLTYFGVNSKFKPPVVSPIPGDPNHFNPVVDETKVYPGVWAICTLNAYDYGLNPPQPKKGPGFGLQSVLIIADDTNIGAGGAADPNKTFGGLALPPAPITRPNIGALPGGAPGAPGAPPSMPPQSMPGAPSSAPAIPRTIETTYRVAPPPPSAPDDDDLAFLLS